VAQSVLNGARGERPYAARTVRSHGADWAHTLDTPPFQAYAVTCGVTFTFGGKRVDANAQVLDTDLRPILGLLAAAGRHGPHGRHRVR
jgi:hypothetical protein